MTTGVEHGDRLHLDRLAADGWPPLEQVVVDGWRLRAARGVTRRGNSALPLSGSMPLDAVLEFYRSRGLPAAVQVSDPALDDRLAERGWTLQTPTQVMTGPVPAGADGEVADRPDDDWLSCWWSVDGRGGAPGLDVARACLARVRPPSAYARVRAGDRTVAVGRGVLQEGVLGVFAMAVLPEHRRSGLARRVLGTLGSWAAEAGATSAYLQVRSDNDAAVGLYRSCGLARAYDYAYRYGPSA